MKDELLKRYPTLKECENDINDAVDIIEKTFSEGGKLLLCGNGGSCADCDHISGELMKGFLKKRELSEDKKSEMRARFPMIEESTLEKLQAALPAIPLPSFTALNSASKDYILFPTRNSSVLEDRHFNLKEMLIFPAEYPVSSTFPQRLWLLIYKSEFSGHLLFSTLIT